MNKLCCLINKYVTCTACSNEYCQDCWEDLYFISHPNRDPSPSELYGFEPRTCATTSTKISLTPESIYPNFTFKKDGSK